MRKFLFYTSILSLLIACNKEEIPSTIENNLKSENLITFKDYSEYFSTVERVSNMDEQGRIAWEESLGFKSFGTICDEYYYSFDFENLSNFSDFKKEESVNQYFSFREDLSGIHIEPKEMKSKERYIANKDKLFIIGDEAFKLCDSDLISTKIENIEKLKMINNKTDALLSGIFSINSTSWGEKNFKSTFAEKDEKSVQSSNGDYKIKLEIETENYWAFSPTRTLREVEFWITNYKRNIIGVFYVKKAATTYDIYIDTYDTEAPDVYLHLEASAKNHDIGSYNKTEKVFVCDGWTNKYNPKFSTVTATASSYATASLSR